MRKNVSSAPSSRLPNWQATPLLLLRAALRCAVLCCVPGKCSEAPSSAIGCNDDTLCCTGQRYAVRAVSSAVQSSANPVPIQTDGSVPAQHSIQQCMSNARGWGTQVKVIHTSEVLYRGILQQDHRHSFSQSINQSITYMQAHRASRSADRPISLLFEIGRSIKQSNESLSTGKVEYSTTRQARLQVYSRYPLTSGVCVGTG